VEGGLTAAAPGYAGPMSHPPTTGHHVVVGSLGADPLDAIEHHLALAPMALPEAGPGEVVVAVRAAQVGWVDLIMACGQYQHVPDVPYTPGLEWAGEVVSVGEGVTGWAPGDAVLADGFRTGPRSAGAHRAWGGFGTWTVAAADALLPLPAGLSFAEAACLLGSYETAWHALVHRAAVRPGDVVLVLGASGATGLAAVHLAARAGATVIAAGRSVDKLALVAAEGAHHTIDAAPAELPAAVKALTGGRGATVVWDGVGGALSEAGIRAAAFGARFCVVGWAATPAAGRGSVPANALPTNLILMKGLDVLGCPAVIATQKDPALRGPRLRGVLAAVEEGLRPRVDSTWPLTAVKDALRAKWSGQGVGGLVLAP
jgi:NADPH2:quinone reductase